MFTIGTVHGPALTSVTRNALPFTKRSTPSNNAARNSPGRACGLCSTRREAERKLFFDIVLVRTDEQIELCLLVMTAEPAGDLI